MRVVGWRCWFEDETTPGKLRVYDSQTSNWSDLPKTGLLVKMIYYDNGGKQIQTADWYIETPHPKGIIRRTCSDNQENEMRKKYPQGVFIKGDWTVDEWHNEIVNLAMASTWDA